MSATKILWGQITVVFLIVLATTWGATQWTAWRLGFQPQLGAPWFELAGVPFYYPPAFFWWWYFYEAYAPPIFVEGAFIAASGGFISIAVAIGMSVWRAREAKNVETYGSARWANRNEVKSAGLLGPDGVVLGKLDRDYLRHDGPEHVLCFAPTRSGKGVGLVVPSLLTWPGSAIVHDIKGENWQLTAGFRARHGRVLLFDPTNTKSSAYNPLLEVRRGEWEVRDVQNVADVLVDPEGSLEKRNHWEKTSHSLLVGAILHVLYAEPDKTLAGVAGFLSDPKRPIETTLAAMMTTPHLGAAGPHPVVASTARELLNKSDNERSGVLSTAMSFLGLYRDPVVAEVTRRCDWRIADIVAEPRPATLYLVVPPSDISRTKPLIRLVLNQIGRRLTEDLHAKDRRHRVLMMLDEFPALGRLDFFESALAFMAGYGLKAFLITQSLNQIEKAYGANNSILDNCHVRVSFATNDARTAKRVSDALGTATEMKAMFVRFWLTITPPLPNDAQAAAQIKGRERFEGFIEALGRRLQKGQSFLREIPILKALWSPSERLPPGVTIGTSIGIAAFPNDATDADTLVGHADAALYEAKAKGRGVFRFYEPRVGASLRERRQLEHDVRQALARRELSLVYQPQADLKSGRIFGFEALLRWDHPTRGRVPPAEFIPVAEECGAILKIGDWVLRSACAEATCWLSPLAVAVNVSTAQLLGGRLPELVRDVLGDTGLEPSRLELEITEATLVEDSVRALAVLVRLKALGVRIAMDDFGTGYSSLTNLRSFPFDRIKMDESFVRSVHIDDQAAAIMRAMFGLARGLNLPVIAEGVETEGELSFLRGEACAAVQGHLLGSPAPIQHFNHVTRGRRLAERNLRLVGNA